MNVDWTEALPSLRDLDAQTRSELRKSARRVTIPQGTTVFRPGDACTQFPLIVSGSIRVQRVTESGREILLFRVTANETCILTIASLLASESYEAEAITETDVVAYVLSPGPFSSTESRDFRRFALRGDLIFWRFGSLAHGGEDGHLRGRE